jgi:superfamily I DNA/RNA helicase
MNRGALKKGPRELAEIFPASKTVTKDELAEWETLSGRELAERLKSYFDPWWAFPKLTQQQIKVIRSAIHPDVVLSQTENDLSVLDLRQEANARAIGGGHRVVYGVAGSGKTVLLVARAKLLAGQHSKKVLLLCHNYQLASDLAARVEAYQDIRVMTFFSWGVRNGAEFRAGEADDAYGERLLSRLKDGGRDCGQFDAVLIDEAQDWPCSWFHCAKLAMKEPEAGDLLIVGDGSQSLYRARNFSWEKAGVNARGRTVSAKFDLDRNYRNTGEILRAAQPFSAKPKRGQPRESAGMEALAVDPDKAIRNGPEPEIVELDNAREECLYAAALIEGWLRGGVEIRGRRERIAARDIAILYPRLRKETDIATLVERLSGFTRVIRLTPREKATGTLREDGVRIMTIKSSRGLQFRIVVLLWTDLLPYEPQNDERSELYVAMTRAEDMLVILHSGHSAYVEELRENARAGSPN